MSLVFASMTSLNLVSKWFCWLNRRAYLLRKSSFAMSGVIRVGRIRAHLISPFVRALLSNQPGREQDQLPR